MLRGIGFGLLLLAALAHGEDPEVYKLHRYGLSPTYESLGAYLKAMYPTPRLERLLASYVVDLGDPDPERREHAIRELHRAGASAATVLARALDSEDPEVVRHVRWLLDSARELLESEPMFAAYTTIARRQIRGLTGEVVHSIPLAKDAYVRVAGRRALVATATREDADLLREAAGSGGPELRAAAVRALAAVLGDEARPELRGYLKDPDPNVLYAAAVALAELQDPASLPALVELLDAPGPQLRFSSVEALRRLSGKRFEYAAYASAEERAPKVDRWKQWLKEEAASVAWEQVRESSSGFQNRILVSVSLNNQSELIEIDLDGTVRSSRKVDGNIQGVCALPNGDRIVSLWGRRVVIQYDPLGAEVWRSPQFPSNPGCVQRLVDGSTLVCFAMTGEIREVSASGETIRTLNAGKGVYFAERLVSGITRVGQFTQRKIIDLDRHGRVVRETQLSANPFTVRQLENGNMLVCLYSMNRVEEHAPGGKVERTIGQFSRPTSAFRIANGVTLVGAGDGVWRIDGEGRRSRILQKSGAIWISYY